MSVISVNVSFIEFLAKNNAIRFGGFTLKSGRNSPYFIDLGVLTTGPSTSELGRYYASKINEVFSTNFDVVFGPAYKAVPIAITTTIALNNLGMNKRWLFDRKEVKIHGADAGTVFVGAQDLDHGQRVIIVDDVFTTGGTKVEAIEKLEKSLKAEVVGIVIAVDRMEIGKKNNATAEFSESTGIPVHAIVDIHSIFTHLKGSPVDGKLYVTDKIFESYQRYMNKYGVRT